MEILLHSFVTMYSMNMKNRWHTHTHTHCFHCSVAVLQHSSCIAYVMTRHTVGCTSESDHSLVFQLCLRGPGLQAWRLQQETLWFGRAGESHLQCTHLFVALFVSQHEHLLIFFPLILILDSSVDDPPPPLSLSLSLIAFPTVCWHGWATEGGWWVMTYWVWSRDVLCQVWLTMVASLKEI